MHPNPVYRQESRDRNLEFARERGFGVLSVNGDPAPMVSHVPFALSEDGASADLHLVRSNPIARAATGALPAVIAVTGPDGYISPDWYGDPAQVPTWNYVAVHLRGTLHPLPDEALQASLETLTEMFETRLLPKKPWTLDKTPEDVQERLMRMVRPFRFEVAEVDGTWKLAQNKSSKARQSAASQLNGAQIGQETALLAALMMGVEHGE
ncbi:FMN-binding negative transcriptional regulator [Nioella sediminis]|jgi:transcriptional regulator|uniref:FMN-binding negative transcriptional regulator n=1 Tax=Nioella sediminis TaxID=1912092 RepID=UPI0008FD79D2|nr:FMN-binding negative transcriptional regulator [Nioella sediminis]TBX28282.1 negative transcriptional regulator [Roseovarius sp. JS7-11]